MLHRNSHNLSLRKTEEKSEVRDANPEEKPVVTEALTQIVPSPLENQESATQENATEEQPVAAPEPPAAYYRPNQSSFFEQEMAESQRQKEEVVLAVNPTVPPVVAAVEAPESRPAQESPATTQDSSIANIAVVTAKEPKDSTVQAPVVAGMPPRPSEEKQVSDSGAAPVLPIVAVQGAVGVQPSDSASKPGNVYFDSSVVDAYVSPDDMPAIALPLDSVTDSTGQRPTSRFRREPNFPNKLKGTLVAEFPQRMVIEYAPGVFRDPFETLIDETKQSDGPRVERIPDVETSRLVGVIETETGDNRALLEDLDGYGYILKSGDKVKKGYVERIDIDKAFFQLFEYGWSRTIALYLGHN